MGGGQHGHLGLVLTAQQYGLLSQQPYQRPQRPAPLIIPEFQLPHITQNLQARHAEQVRLFNECNNVEQALKQQIVKAIDDAYLTALRNRQTNTIDVTLPVLIDYLFTNHGRVTPAMLQHEEKQVQEMFYDPIHPVDVIFNKVEDLADLAAAARTEFSEPQLINFAYVILNATGKYQPYIREWSRLAPDRKTWANFKTHFRQAHQELKEAGDLQIRNTQFNSANLVQEVIDGVQSALAPPEASNDPTPDVIDQMANAAAQQQLMPQMMQQMVQLMQQMAVIQQNMNMNSSRTSSLSSSSTSNSRNTRQRTNTQHYCWSHGACAHTSSNCRSKCPGHQDNASFNNKMGGSTAYCPPAST